MRKGRVHHGDWARRFEDLRPGFGDDVISFFFDLKLILPPGLTSSDVQRARQTVERRLQRIVRKRDRVVWTADGFFLMVSTTDKARAGAAAERVEQDVALTLGVGDNARDFGHWCDDDVDAPAAALELDEGDVAPAWA